MTNPESSAAKYDPSDEPVYGASLATAVRRFWAKYARFSGRSSRSEYWWMALVEVVVLVVLGLLAHLGGAGVEDASGRMVGANALGVITAAIAVILLIGLIIPNLALTVRRLHDANLSGGFIFLGLIPSIGGLIIFVFTLLPGNPLGVRFDRK